MGQENKFIRSLVKKARLGKLPALEELYEINLNHIYTLILRLAGNKSLAELITKNTLVTAWKGIKENGPDNITFSEWLKNIAVKITTDELRNSSDPKRINGAKDDQPDGSSSDILEQALADLDDESRIILVLNKIENYSFGHISELLNITDLDVVNKFSYAMEKISQSLSNAESSININDLPASIPNELEADIEVLQGALDEIMEMRFEEIQESKDEIDAEELEEFRRYEEGKKEERRKEAEAKKRRNKESRKWKVSKFHKKILLRIALPVLITVVFIYSFASTESWKAYSTSGTPLLNKKPFSQSINFTQGDLITVDENSDAIIEMPGIGKIEVFNGTSVKRLEEDNSCELLGGKLVINAVGAKENLSIVVPEATIKDYSVGTKYSVQVDKRGNSVIGLEAGWLRVGSDKNVIIFPKHYSLRILNGGGVSIPYYSNSESDLINLLEEYLFSGKMGITLNKIIELSTERETITLWNLLQRVKPKHRSAVYEKLYELEPHPDSIEKKEILNLDPDALRGWFEEIEWLL